MIPYYKDRICLNVLAGNFENAREVYKAANGHAVIGVLSSNYPDVSSAVEDMKKYDEVLDGNLSVGLGGGNPLQWKSVCSISKTLKTAHYNQIFPMVSAQRICVDNEDAHINALVSPCGKPGFVKVSTGPLSQDAPDAIIPVETAILMIKEMGGNAIKFFPMKGLSCRDELIEVAKACAKHHFALEPTGGIDLENFEEIITIIMNCGVQHIIPHVYSSIIDKNTGETKVEAVKKLHSIVERLVG